MHFIKVNKYKEEIEYKNATKMEHKPCIIINKYETDTQYNV